MRVMKLCLIMPHKTNVKLNFIQNMDNIMDMCFILAEQYNFQLCAQQRAINLTGANPVCEGLASQQ